MKLSDLINAVLHRTSQISLALRLAVQTRFRLTHNYQPDPFSHAGNDSRACAARFAAAAAELADLERPSVLDVGCNQGYFTFRFAEKGGICLGFDNDRAELMVARARAAVHRVHNVAFFEMLLDTKSIKGLPESDVVICLSIFHHWVRHYGQKGAEDLMRDLAGRAGKAMVFDTGQPEETATRWARQLDFMKPDGPAWIEGFLKDLGFAQVRRLGQFPTSLSPVPRELFVARR